MPASRSFYLYLAALFAALLISGVQPYDRATWWLEVFPVMIAIPVLFFTRQSFPLTPLAYGLIAIHCLILLYGGHYTYAKTPFGFWLRDALELTRNPYDRIGHLAQGFIPAILSREILLRVTPLRPGKMLFFLVVCVCMAISACYELIEWQAAILFGEGAQEFLAMQGDVWDTQWDMFMALVGAVLALLTLSREHDRQLRRLNRA